MDDLHRAEDIVRGPIDKNREHLRSLFHGIDNRFVLLQILRNLDFHLILGARSSNESDRLEVTRLFSWGFNESLHLYWNEDVRRDGVPLMPANSRIKSVIDNLLVAAGKICLIEYQLPFIRDGLMEVVVARQGLLELALSTSATGVEAVEREELRFLTDQIAAHPFIKFGAESLAARRDEITGRMSKLLRRWGGHYIAYETSPEIDAFYRDAGNIHASQCMGWDAFPHTANFNGLPFSTYIEFISRLVGFARLHCDYCILAANRWPESIDLLNILAIPLERSKEVEITADILGITLPQADELLSCSEVHDSNAAHHLSMPNAPCAPFYRIGSQSIARSVTGSTTEPFLFLLQELRRKYRRDWDAAVDGREEVFREELIALFFTHPSAHALLGNLNIRSDLGNTDIDAIIVDPRTHTVGLFQLKWQDYFGASAREWASRRSNFVGKANEWVDRVTNWVAAGRLKPALISSGLPPKLADGIVHTYIFVIGRNFARFSGGREVARSGAAWGHWAQVSRMASEPEFVENPVKHLHSRLMHEFNAKAAIGSKRNEITIDGLTLILHPPNTTSQERSP